MLPMRSDPSVIETAPMPAWFWGLLRVRTVPDEGSALTIAGRRFIVRDGILRGEALYSAAQQQTTETFGFKWHQRETFESEASRTMMRHWANDRYGPVDHWIAELGGRPVVVDAGCGGAFTGREYFGPVLDRIRYLGVDISRAVDVARARMAEVAADAAFLQCDLTTLPFPEDSLDVVFSEGVLHHTDSTERAIKALVPLVRPGGLFLFYVYREKGPIREFTDDYIREKMQQMSPEEGWKAIMPLTKLGKTLGDLNIEIDIDEPIELLGLPAGRVNLQRLFYWHICKAFYRPEYSLDEMNHINFDWYAPQNAFRQTPEQVRTWCGEAGLTIERERIEESGITIVARRTA